MSLNRYAAKRDTVEKEIVAALRAAGCSVAHLSERGAPDLVIGLAGNTMLMEVKSAKGKLTMDQESWKMRWNGGTIFVARSVDEALEWLRRWRSDLGLEKTRSAAR